MPTLRKGWDNPRAQGPGPAIALQGLLPQTARLAWARRVCGHAAGREAAGCTRRGCWHASVPTSPGLRTRRHTGKRLCLRGGAWQADLPPTVGRVKNRCGEPNVRSSRPSLFER